MRFDKNGNGKLEIDELPERLKARFDSFDANKDGVLSSDEMKAGMQGGRLGRFAASDTNGDHVLDANELGARYDRMKVADTNGDGKLTEQELNDAIASGKLARPRSERGPRESSQTPAAR
jgi:Ca2+-binding EF-hand superfamily protein